MAYRSPSDTLQRSQDVRDQSQRAPSPIPNPALQPPQQNNPQPEVQGYAGGGDDLVDFGGYRYASGVLPYLQTHLSIREIGERLFISRNTVSSEVGSIYRKLGVSARSEAVERAMGLGLLGA